LDISGEEQKLLTARNKGGFPLMMSYLRLSGPGWLQSALTLGGGSLGSSLYLGVLAGYSLLWLQPLAMLFGIVMLSAIGYFTTSTERSPFQVINSDVNPILGWGWALASLIASIVWSMPQYSLATAVVQQNLFPDLLSGEGAKISIVVVFLIISVITTWSYEKGQVGFKFYDLVLKIAVALIVVCFGTVVITLMLSEKGLNWQALYRGFIPNLNSLLYPSEEYEFLLNSIEDKYRYYWSDLIVQKQTDVLVSAAATAVGINMTFLFPYTILKRRWGRPFKGFVIFDLATGMLIPFVLATSCVVIAAASQFHTQVQPGLSWKESNVQSVVASKKQQKEFNEMLEKRWLTTEGTKQKKASLSFSIAEQKLAATLVTRDAFDLAKSLKPLGGGILTNYIFGIGVLGMALSTITLLMLASGLIICEMLKLPHSGWNYRLATLGGCIGALGPFIWTKAAFWLVVPTSVFGFTLLPLAYLTFCLVMNRKDILGRDMPKGKSRWIWNVLMLIAAGVASFGSLLMIWGKAGIWGMVLIGIFGFLAVIFHRRKRYSE